MIAALAQRPCRFEARGSCTDDHDILVTFSWRDDLRVPAAAPFLAHGRVLRAADGDKARISRHADVAADAFADIFNTPVFDLLRQKRICNRGSAPHRSYP